jgi:hypothetical protein
MHDGSRSRSRAAVHHHRTNCIRIITINHQPPAKALQQRNSGPGEERISVRKAENWKLPNPCTWNG